MDHARDYIVSYHNRGVTNSPTCVHSYAPVCAPLQRQHWPPQNMEPCGTSSRTELWPLSFTMQCCSTPGEPLLHQNVKKTPREHAPLCKQEFQQVALGGLSSGGDVLLLLCATCYHLSLSAPADAPCCYSQACVKFDFQFELQTHTPPVWQHNFILVGLDAMIHLPCLSRCVSSPSSPW